MGKFRMFLVFVGHLIAFSVLAFIISLPLGATGFWSGYIGWAIVIPLVINEMDTETKEALKKWATKHKDGDCND